MTTPARMNIVVEGASDAAILKALLVDKLGKKPRFFSSRGQMSLATLARNLLVHEGGSVVVVMDADTRDPHRAEESQSMVKTALRQIAPEGSFDVYAFLPELEVIFFEAPEFLELMIGRKISEEVIWEGLLAPKQALKNLGRQGGSNFDAARLASAIDSSTAPVLLGGKQLKSLAEKIHALLNSPVAA